MKHRPKGGASNKAALDPRLDAVLDAILASAKYRVLAPDFVASVVRKEAVKEKSTHAAVKRVKRRLHQMVGAYIDARPRYDSWLRRIREASSGAEVHSILAEILRGHVSTRERLERCPDFYTRIFEGLPPPRSLADFACGFGPMARPLMAIPADASLTLYDVVTDMVAFELDALKALGYAATGGTWNIMEGIPPVHADIVLLLKTLPCLAHAEKNICRRLIGEIAAPVTIVSFPVASLGGHAREMASFYEQRFRREIDGLPYRVERLSISNELVFRLHRTGSGHR